jgi:SAM-dependent methyltransferase
MTTATFETTLAEVAGVEGWMTDDQARRLWTAAGRVPPGRTIVEIGSFRGRSTIVLARGARDGAEVVAIDPHGGGDRGPNESAPDAGRGEEDYQVFHANLHRAGVQDRVRHVRRPSQQAFDAVPTAVDLLYVDGAHRFGPARDDITRWGERVSTGGTMLIHDSFNAIGVTLAIMRVLLASPHWRYIGRSGSLAEYRNEPLEIGDRVRNAVSQLAQLPYFVRNGLVKLALLGRAGPVARLLGHHTGDWPY